MVDVRSQGICQLNRVESSAEALLACNNRISSFSRQFFLGNWRLWRIDLSKNRITHLNFLEVFSNLGYLDLRDNLIGLEDLKSLSNIHIMSLKISGNEFQKDPNFDPLWISGICKFTWLIDSVFVSDYIRQLSYTLRKSSQTIGLLSSGIVPSKGRFNSSLIGQSLSSVVDSPPLSSFTGRTIVNPKGVFLMATTEKPQCDRMRFLNSFLLFSLPRLSFSDSFGLSLGILSELWLGEDPSLIPRFLCKELWAMKSEDILNLESWQLLIMLNRINESITFDNSQNEELWKALKLKRFLNDGKPPQPGSTARHLISAFFARAVVENDVTSAPVSDLKIYFRYRKVCGFTKTNGSLEAIYDELIRPFPTQSDSPKVGDNVTIINPLSDKWNNGVVITKKRGRLLVADNGIIIQIPESSVYWDARGTWRESAKSSGLSREVRSPRRIRSGNTFITSIEDGEFLNTKCSIAVPKSPEIPRDSPRHFDGHSQFRGIVDPPLQPHRHLPKAPQPSPETNYVDKVVNISHGKEIEIGRRAMRFHLKFVNQLTNRSEYRCVNEEDITPSDVDILLKLFREHIEERLMCTPSF